MGEETFDESYIEEPSMPSITKSVLRAVQHSDSNVLKRADDKVLAKADDKVPEKAVDVAVVRNVSPSNATLASLMAPLDKNTTTRINNRTRSLVNTAISEARSYSDMIRGDREYINRHKIEKQRKFTLSIACLLLFLIGAPFGSIVRKGGLGMPLVASVGFFVLYYVVGMIAEKAVRESVLGPWGMWVSSLVMLPIGIVLTLQATTDSSFFDGATWKKFFKRLFGKKPDASL